MSTTTIKLPFKRFVRQVVTGPRSKSTYLAMMAENLEKLKSAPWREADSAVQVGLVPHDFTLPSFASDQYDAFKMTGAYNHAAGTETATAGMAAYRFTLPQAFAASGSTVHITGVSIPITRDRFCREGLRIAVVYGLSDEVPDDFSWSTLRGEFAASDPPGHSGYDEWEALTQKNVAALSLADAADDVVSISGYAGDDRFAYLWIVVSMEDYEDRWEMYNEQESRAYAIEGSGMIIGDLVEVTFDADITNPDSDPNLAAAVSYRLNTASWPANNVKDSGASNTINGTAHKIFAPATGGPFLALLDGAGTHIPLVVYKNAAKQFASIGWQHDGFASMDAALAWWNGEMGQLLTKGRGITDAALLPITEATLVDNNPTQDFELYVSTKDGVFCMGTLKQATAADFTLYPANARKLDTPGGDLILAIPRGNFLYGGTSHKTWNVCAVTCGDGMISVDGISIPYDGEITGLGRFDNVDSGKFIVAGDLRSVAGVPCQTFGTVTVATTTGQLAFQPGDGQAAFMPNVYSNFRVVKANVYMALGDFTTLGGVSTPYGIGCMSSSNGVPIAAADEALGSLGIPSDRYVIDVVGNAAGNQRMSISANRYQTIA